MPSILNEARGDVSNPQRVYNTWCLPKKTGSENGDVLGTLI